jgi:hypothetical protein
MGGGGWVCKQEFHGPGFVASSHRNTLDLLPGYWSQQAMGVQIGQLFLLPFIFVHKRTSLISATLIFSQSLNPYLDGYINMRSPGAGELI